MDYILYNAVPIAAATVVAYLVGLALRAPSGAPAGLAGQIATLVAEAWLAAILAGALILAPTSTGAGPWTMALASAAVIWAGFVAPAIVASHVHRRLGVGAIVADAAYVLVVMLVQAAVLHGVGVGLPAGPPPVAST